jgi:hypothetical protein
MGMRSLKTGNADGAAKGVKMVLRLKKAAFCHLQ